MLGLDHVVIKAHRRSNAHAIANAVKVAAKAVRDGATEKVAAAVAAVG
jgi:fatty acid/phospholipid biosynthesis enzyme